MCVFPKRYSRSVSWKSIFNGEECKPEITISQSSVPLVYNTEPCTSFQPLRLEAGECLEEREMEQELCAGSPCSH